MELYNMLKNISGKNNEEELKKCISNVRNTLNGLEPYRTCKIYSSFLLNELNKQHIPARLINTLDLGLKYEHIFILVPSNKTGYFLVDLTFSQFNSKLEQLNQLLNNGYQFMTDNNLKEYLNIISKGNLKNNLHIDDVFYLSKII